MGAQRRAGASSDVLDHNVSETDRICMQLFLDIQVRIPIALHVSFVICIAMSWTEMSYSTHLPRNGFVRLNWNGSSGAECI